jgi:outer membrane receptor protein involved in Fe transport
MKKSFKLFCKGIAGIKIMLLTVAIVSSNVVYAQEIQSITGKLIEEKSNQAVSFATVVLIKASDSKIAGGSMSDENGVFSISPVNSDNYILKVSNIGYKPVTRNIEVINSGVTDAGILLLQDTSIMLKELVIVGERIKAKSESDRTTYNVTKKMLDVSNTGTDVLKLIPGVQIDLMQNVSLEGSPDILIFVDGKERDKSFISQLNPNQIDRIEVISAPPSNYDGNVTGAINIVLKKDRDSGISGHILAEIPVSSSLVYVFPSYSLNLGFKKLNLYTSYNGELTYLDLHESTKRNVWNENDSNELSLNQDLRQKDWSHRFHYGLDYFLSDKDQLNFYGYYNPYSRELDGDVYSRMSGTNNDSLKSVKDDTDLNTSTFYSLYYKHTFDKKGSEITADISNHFLTAENRTDYLYSGPDENIISKEYAVKPKQNAFSLRIDYKTIFLDKFIFSTGVKAKLQKSQDRYNEFEYNENIYAIYSNIAYKQEKIDLSIGLRTEKSVSELKDAFINLFLSFLPSATVRYKLTSKQNIQASFNHTIKRPNIYQLNPYTSLSDPYTVSKGNPFLKPELLSSLYLEHSVQLNGNYLASRLFFNRTTNHITNLMFINNTSTFETQVQNLGSVNQLGLQFSGTLKIAFATFNPYIKIYGLQTSGNNIAKYYSIRNKNSMGLESGLSAIVSFKHDIACSLTLQYNSAKYDIQGSSYSDVLYFLSVEKTFKQKIKLGIVTAMPFTRSFTYNGSKISDGNFQNTYEGNVIMPAIPFWFKLGFQFNSGKSRSKISREKDEIDNPQKKGF